jgi:hypothetical protein
MTLITFEDMPLPTSQKPASQLPYLAAVLFMTLLGVVAILVLTALKPATDNTLLIATVIGFLTPTTLSLMAFMKSQETHLMVNSRLAEFMASAKRISHYEGKEEGHAEGITEGELRFAPHVIPVVALPSTVLAVDTNLTTHDSNVLAHDSNALAHDTNAVAHKIDDDATARKASEPGASDAANKKKDS